MKRVLKLVVLVVMIGVSFAYILPNGQGSNIPFTSSTNYQVLVSPPKVVISSINYLENNPGRYMLSDGVTAISDNGVIKIFCVSENWTETLINIQSQASNVQRKLIFNSTYLGIENTTIIMLKSTNGHSFSVTNFQGYPTAIFNITTINATTSVEVLAAYPTFAVVRVMYIQTTPMIIPPGGGGGNSGYYVSNHTEEYYQGHPGDEIQEWFNFTYWFYDNSAGQPRFVDAWWNNTVEVPTSLYSGGPLYEETHFYPMYGTWNSQNSQPIGGSPTNYTNNNESWSFSVYNWKDRNENPIGYTAWENDTMVYTPAGYLPVLATISASVPVQVVQG